MAIEYERLMAINIPEVAHRYGVRDTILYALAIGLGHDPLDENALHFCYEKELRVLPTMAVILAHPGFWMRDLDTGIDWVRIVHIGQSLMLHAPLPVEGSVLGRTHVVDIIDRGEGKGAVITFERCLYEQTSGMLLASMLQTSLCRGDGGFGGPRREAPKSPPLPPRKADLFIDLPTRPEAALLYRMSSDPNPLHAEPAVARAAGFQRPILHGLATFGVVGHALLRGLCDFDPLRLVAISLRFSNPVIPGDTIRTEIWHEGAETRFQAHVIERDVVVVTNGHATVVASPARSQIPRRQSATCVPSANNTLPSTQA
jgi:acyl dehydratase